MLKYHLRSEGTTILVSHKSFNIVKMCICVPFLDTVQKKKVTFGQIIIIGDK